MWDGGNKNIFTQSIWHFSQLFQCKQWIWATILFKFLSPVSFIWILATVWGDGFRKSIFLDRKLRKQQPKTARPIKGRKSLIGEQRVKNLQCWEYTKSSTLQWNLVKYFTEKYYFLWHIFQSATFWLQHVDLFRPRAKFGTCQCFPPQKLEINKIGSSATQL